MNCDICNHPLIEHGDYPEEFCDCCSGRKWSEVKAVVHKDVPRRFHPIPGYPNYIIHRNGSVKYAPTGKLCLFLKFNRSGETLISIRDGKVNKPVSVQHLLAITFPKEKTDD